MSRVLINGQDVNMTDGFPEMNYAEWKALPKELRPDFTIIKDRDYTGEPLDISVSVTADGVKTYSQLLNELYALVDKDRVSRDSYLSTGGYNIPVVYKSSSAIRIVGCMLADAGNTYINGYYLMESNSTLYSWSVKTSGNTVTNSSSSVPTTGTTFTLYYNIVASAGVEPDIFYKDIPIAGVQVSSYYATVNTGIDSTKYVCIGMDDYAGAGWDQNTIFRVSTGNVLKILSMRTESYTIASNAPPIRLYFVKSSRINATPLT